MNIILVGACGRMGKNVAEVAAERGVNIAAGVDVVPAQLSFPLYASIADVREHADAVIDFSSASGLEGTLSKCEKEHLPVVLAATGYTEAPPPTCCRRPCGRCWAIMSTRQVRTRTPM